MTTDATSLSLAERIERFERALTASDLADLLSISKKTVYGRAKDGKIPSFRIGSCVRFDPKAVGQWLRGLSVDTVTHVHIHRIQPQSNWVRKKLAKQKAP